MRQLLLDLNVVLDVLLDRKPHVEPAAALWAAIESGRADGLLPAHGFTTIHDLARQARGPRFARQTLEDVLRVFGVAPVDTGVVRSALGLAWTDFEDAVCAAAAAASGASTPSSGPPSERSRARHPPVTATGVSPRAANPRQRGRRTRYVQRIRV